MSKSKLALERNHKHDAVYCVGEKVKFTITINGTARMHLGDTVAGTVVNVLEACGVRMYRVELDTEPNKTIAGNVFAYELARS